MSEHCFENSPWTKMLVVNDGISQGAFKVAPSLVASHTVGQRFPHCGLWTLWGWETVFMDHDPSKHSTLFASNNTVTSFSCFFFLIAYYFYNMPYFCCTMKLITICVHMQLSLIDNFSCARHCSGTFHIYLLRQFSDLVEASNISISSIEETEPQKGEVSYLRSLTIINKVMVLIHAVWLQSPLLITGTTILLREADHVSCMWAICMLSVCRSVMIVVWTTVLVVKQGGRRG